MDRKECAADLYCAAINGGTIYSYESSKEWIFTLTDIGTNEISGTFCKRGRGPEEFINVFPLQDFYIEDRETKTLLFSYYDARLVTWNISKSMETGADVYENPVHINDSTKYFPLGSIHRLSRNEMLVLDTRQNPKSEKMAEPPVYAIYDMTDRKVSRKYELFRNPCVELKGDALTSKSVLSLHDCIKPDGTRVAMAMGFSPQINILDIHTGECLGFRIKGATRFSPEHHTWHFTSAAADSRFIY
ncbi:MAG: hypothetical protein NC308_04400 [Clostridium sp.]|nr:hypothetical protein [Bacteroides sp.]MCM1198108.1 hypothetical protein [Clostridium sp.]